MGNNMAIKKDHIGHCLPSEYDKVFPVADTCHSIYQVYAENATDDSIYCRWFRKFWDREQGKLTQGN